MPLPDLDLCRWALDLLGDSQGDLRDGTPFPRELRDLDLECERDLELEGEAARRPVTAGRGDLGGEGPRWPFCCLEGAVPGERLASRAPRSVPAAPTLGLGPRCSGTVGRGGATDTSEDTAWPVFSWLPRSLASSPSSLSSSASSRAVSRASLLRGPPSLSSLREERLCRRLLLLPLLAEASSLARFRGSLLRASPPPPSLSLTFSALSLPLRSACLRLPLLRATFSVLEEWPFLVFFFLRPLSSPELDPEDESSDPESEPDSESSSDSDEDSSDESEAPLLPLPPLFFRFFSGFFLRRFSTAGFLLFSFLPDAESSSSSSSSESLLEERWRLSALAAVVCLREDAPLRDCFLAAEELCGATSECSLSSSSWRRRWCLACFRRCAGGGASSTRLRLSAEPSRSAVTAPPFLLRRGGGGGASSGSSSLLDFLASP